MFIKIKNYRIAERGRRGKAITIPPIFIRDNQLSPGDQLSVYRGIINGRDALVIMKADEAFISTSDELRVMSNEQEASSKKQEASSEEVKDEN